MYSEIRFGVSLKYISTPLTKTTLKNKLHILFIEYEIPQTKLVFCVPDKKVAAKCTLRKRYTDIIIKLNCHCIIPCGNKTDNIEMEIIAAG